MDSVRGSFRIKAGTLDNFRAHFVNKLRKNGYTIDECSLRGKELRLVATRGNRILHYLYEQLLEGVPFSEYFGWAVRVRVVLASSGDVKDGAHTVYVSTEPASNEMDPIEEYFDHGPTWEERIGEGRKCRQAYELMAQLLVRCPYYAR